MTEQAVLGTLEFKEEERQELEQTLKVKGAPLVEKVVKRFCFYYYADLMVDTASSAVPVLALRALHCIVYVQCIVGALTLY